MWTPAASCIDTSEGRARRTPTPFPTEHTLRSPSRTTLRSRGPSPLDRMEASSASQTIVVMYSGGEECRAPGASLRSAPGNQGFRWAPPGVERSPRTRIRGGAHAFAHAGVMGDHRGGFRKGGFDGVCRFEFRRLRQRVLPPFAAPLSGRTGHGRVAPPWVDLPCLSRILPPPKLVLPRSVACVFLLLRPVRANTGDRLISLKALP